MAESEHIGMSASDDHSIRDSSSVVADLAMDSSAHISDPLEVHASASATIHLHHWGMKESTHRHDMERLITSIPVPMDLPKFSASTAASIDESALQAWRSQYLTTIPTHVPRVFILRGISGSGKSTIARYIVDAVGAANCKICSADNYFVARGEGMYAFSEKLLPEAHATCFGEFVEALRAEVPAILLDNTNTTLDQYAKYLEAVEAQNVSLHGRGRTPYELSIVEISVPNPHYVEYLVMRNKHNVPPWVLQEQYHRFQHDERAIKIDMFVPPSAAPVLAALLERWHAVPLCGLRASDFPPSAINKHGNVSSEGLAAAKGVVKSRLNNVVAAMRRAAQAVIDSNPFPTASPTYRYMDVITTLLTGMYYWIPIKSLAQRLCASRAYIGIFIDQPSRSRLLSASKTAFKQQFGDHVTVKFSPTEADITPELLSCIGMKVDLVATQVVTSQSVQAAVVEMPRFTEAPLRGQMLRTMQRLARGIAHLTMNGISANVVPHITLSTAHRVKPGAANRMLASMLEVAGDDDDSDDDAMSEDVGMATDTLERPQAGGGSGAESSSPTVVEVQVPLRGTFGLCVRLKNRMPAKLTDWRMVSQWYQVQPSKPAPSQAARDGAPSVDRKVAAASTPRRVVVVHEKEASVASRESGSTLLLPYFMAHPRQVWEQLACLYCGKRNHVASVCFHASKYKKYSVRMEKGKSYAEVMAERQHATHAKRPRHQEPASEGLAEALVERAMRRVHEDRSVVHERSTEFTHREPVSWAAADERRETHPAPPSFDRSEPLWRAAEERRPERPPLRAASARSEKRLPYFRENRNAIWDGKACLFDGLTNHASAQCRRRHEFVPYDVHMEAFQSYDQAKWHATHRTRPDRSPQRRP